MLAEKAIQDGALANSFNAKLVGLNQQMEMDEEYNILFRRDEITDEKTPSGTF